MVDLREVELIDVENWNAPGQSSPGTWPCGSCGYPHPVIDSWLVRFRNGGLETSQSIVSCHGCADRARAMLAQEPAPVGERDVDVGQK